jgi:hypothetical protein
VPHLHQGRRRELGEGVDDEGAVEGGHALFRQEKHGEEGHGEERQRTPVHDTAGAVALERADKYQNQRADRENDLRQSRTEIGNGEGGVHRNAEGRRFMFDDIPENYRAQTADNEEEGWRYTQGDKNARRPPELAIVALSTMVVAPPIPDGTGAPPGSPSESGTGALT